MKITKTERGFIAVISMFALDANIDAYGEGITKESAAIAAGKDVASKKRKLNAIGQAKAIADWQQGKAMASPFHLESPAHAAYAREIKALAKSSVALA